MLGDIILWITKAIKQFFCLHNYRYAGKLDFRYEVCPKCDKLKHGGRYE